MGRYVRFPPFVLDLVGGGLWRGKERIPLRPKTFGILRYLAERRGRVVSREELLRAVWAGAAVSETTLKVCVNELRDALCDEVTAPRYLMTVRGQGYCFLPASGSEDRRRRRVRAAARLRS